MEKTKVNQQSAKLDDIFEIVVFLKDNSITREEFHSGLNEVRQDLGGRLDKVEGRLDKAEEQLDKVEMQMVTKDYLDDKLADLRGDMMIMTRRSDAKIDSLIGILRDKEVIGDSDVKKLSVLGPLVK